jgi:hypothetical protein
VRGVAERGVEVIRIDAVWLASAPLDMRAGFDSALARVVQVFGAAHPHHGKRSNNCILARRDSRAASANQRAFSSIRQGINAA